MRPGILTPGSVKPRGVLVAPSKTTDWIQTGLNSNGLNSNFTRADWDLACACGVLRFQTSVYPLSPQPNLHTLNLDSIERFLVCWRAGREQLNWFQRLSPRKWLKLGPRSGPSTTSSDLGISPFPYRGTSLITNTPLLGPYSRTLPRFIWWVKGGGCFFWAVPL